MPRNRLPRVMKHSHPTGRRNHGRPLKRLLDTWEWNGSTSGPTPWQIYDDDDDDPFATRSRMEMLTQFHPTPGSIQSSQLHKMYRSRCTAKNSWWWAERLPETCRVVISIKLEFSASVGFIHKESVTMHGHTIVKKGAPPFTDLSTAWRLMVGFSNQQFYSWRKRPDYPLSRWWFFSQAILDILEKSYFDTY